MAAVCDDVPQHPHGDGAVCADGGGRVHHQPGRLGRQFCGAHGRRELGRPRAQRVRVGPPARVDGPAVQDPQPAARRPMGDGQDLGDARRRLPGGVQVGGGAVQARRDGQHGAN
eukprot:2583073-Prymnesium_polylepis.2